jgi:DNA invertase Pin-like site-specific DNA recombinase
MKVAIYARVSTTDKGQDVNMQLSELKDYCKARKWDLYKEYVDDGISGAKAKRPAFNSLMADARQRKFDICLVWKLNRFSRSMIHLVTSVTELQALGVQFVSLKDSIDFSTPAGRLQFHMMSALAEFERDNLVENVKAGLANAKRKGKTLGRKPIAQIDQKKIIELHLSDQTLSVRAIAQKLSTGDIKFKRGSVHKTLSLFKEGKLQIEGI